MLVEKHYFAPVLLLLLLPSFLPLLLLLLLSRSDSFWSDAALQFNCQKTLTDAGADVFTNSRHYDCCVHVGVAPSINWSCDTPQVLGLTSRINFYRGQTSFEDIKGLFFEVIFILVTKSQLQLSAASRLDHKEVLFMCFRRLCQNERAVALFLGSFGFNNLDVSVCVL